MPREAHTAPLERRPSNVAAARRPVDAYVRTAESHPVTSPTPTNKTNINAMDGVKLLLAVRAASVLQIGLSHCSSPLHDRA